MNPTENALLELINEVQTGPNIQTENSTENLNFTKNALLEQVSEVQK